MASRDANAPRVPMMGPQPVHPYARHNSAMDKTISQDRSDDHGHIFSSARPRPPGGAPPGGMMAGTTMPGTMMPGGFPPGAPQSVPSRHPAYRPYPQWPSTSINKERLPSKIDDDWDIDTDGIETDDSTEPITKKKAAGLAQLLAEQLAANLSDVVGEECPSGSTTSRVMENLVSTVSRLRVENETLKQELQDIRTTQLKTSEETEDVKKTILEEVSNHHHEPVKYVTLYRVFCSDSRGDEPRAAIYLDPPRLLKGDTAREHFRGAIEISSKEKYIEDHPEIAFAVVKDYDCDKDTIHRIVAKEGQRGLRGQALGQDHYPEDTEEEEITVGAAAQAGIKAILKAFPDQFPGFQHPPNFLRSETPWLMDIRFSQFRKPYLLFYLYGKKLIESLEVVDMDDLARESLRLLCHFMESNCSEEWNEANVLFSQGQVSRRHFEMLFRPGELVIRRDPKKNERLNGGLVPWFPNNTDSDEIAICHWTFNGSLDRSRQIARMPDDLGQDHYRHDQLVDITSLDFYPLRFAPEDIKAKFVARGRRFWKCRYQKLVCYNEDGVDSFFKAERRFMIDYAMFKRLHPDNPTFFHHPQFPRPGSTVQAQKLLDVEEPPEEFLFCLPQTIHGFDFTTKTWEALQVDRITDVTWNKEAFSQLVAPADTKELIQAVVSAHGERKNKGLDIIEGKGQGLLVLLHGGPGTGKTLTAESIAEEQERPLYRVTCGDIGTEPKEVEKYLGDVLEIGRAWGCVVLLDEADVFLEERSFSDQKRNAIISIFLRILEYYDGILILTTNRIGSFDEAFKSRIQLALGYPKLKEEDRLTIWRNFVQMLRHTEDCIDVEDLEMNLPKLARFEINGREIRNIITMARHLAKFRREMLRYKHMQDAVESAQKFSEYLNQVKGVSDDDWARADKLR